MSPNLVALGYLLAAVCFILTLSGLSSPTSARQGSIAGIVGMAIAVLFTLFNLPNAGFGNYMMILLALVIGGSIGVIAIRKFERIAMPQLMTASHSLVGMASVFIAAAALNNPYDFGITDAAGHIHDLSLLEMGLGVVIGAITFSGSVAAAARLQGIIPTAPVTVPSRHMIHIGLGVAIILLLMAFMATGNQFAFWTMTLLAFAIGFLLIMPIGSADMPIVVSMLNAYSGWATASIGFMLNNPILIIAGALVGSSSTVLSHMMCKAMNRSFFFVILEGSSAMPAPTTQLTTR